MQILSRTELRKLIEKPEGMGVTIYMPAHLTVDTQQNPIRLKNLLREAKKQLVNTGMRSSEAGELIRPAEKLLPDASFWLHQEDGLALFSSQGFFRYYRLPYTFQEMVVAAERFQIKPILPLFTNNKLFYVLALSQNETRLLQCTRYSFSQLRPAELPVSKEEALKYDVIQLQFRADTLPGPGGRGTIFHGQSVEQDDTKEDILRYFKLIDKGLHEVLRDEQAPLVVAGVNYLHPIYRQANSYPYLMEMGIDENPDNLSIAELHKKAWQMVEHYLEQEQNEVLSRYSEARGSQLTTTDIEQAVISAHDGRVWVLFVAMSIQKWGRYDTQQRKVYAHERYEAGDEDLLDLATVYTLINGGTVYTLAAEKMPEQSPVAAALRY